MTAENNITATTTGDGIGDAASADTGGLADPIVAEITVGCPIDHTFSSFVGSLAQWWPLQDFSLAPDVVEVAVDRRVGGEVTEIHGDGTRARWGEIRVWEPPRRFAMSWEVTPGLEHTIATVTFTAVSGDATRVEIVHSGWAEVDASRTSTHENYVSGWAYVLESFVSHLSERA